MFCDERLYEHTREKMTKYWARLGTFYRHLLGRPLGFLHFITTNSFPSYPKLKNHYNMHIFLNRHPDESGSRHNPEMGSLRCASLEHKFEALCVAQHILSKY